ncbi:ABC transporter substrate-binding protein [Niabella insulamsoli]|uniref:ABC transporter substrate-binding protein n=1 Tax=Niabella insulamsoli TaxID=3144874 RepID=UPI0031FE1766
MKQFCLLLTFFLVAIMHLQAQTFGGARHKMAIFTPLYIDEAFDNAGSYRFSGKNFPKQSINGLEFYHGASLAIDSLNKLNIPLDIHVYDTKSKRETLAQQFSKCAADGVELIIANCSLSELNTLARLGADKKITVLNATVPNDANTTDNPYFVVMNPTIQTQLEGLYNYLKTKYAGKQVTVITRKSSSEKYIRTVFETLNEHFKNAVNFNFREVNDDIALKALGTTTQPTEVGLYVVGSLDTDFGMRVLKQFSESRKNYASLTLIGMPTWENIDLGKADFKGVEVIYSTPFYNARTDAASRYISEYYTKKMYARPSDLVFRAYGLTYRFGQLLNKYGRNINTKLGGSEFRAFFDMNIQPDYQNGKVSHYENKKLYYLKYLDGSLKGVN